MKIPPFRIKKSLKESVKIRFMKFIVVVKSTGCWTWTGYICVRGYPRFWVEGRSSALAHRVGYALFKGPIKRDHVIDHKCRNTFCVNPDHSQQITQQKNIKLIAIRRRQGIR